ncbi:MAG TPA: iron-sulfur cluster assembly scaffold protein [Planctomycetota bacterium]|nr:iron-sulfur cluster assembly scaffold protein [Planctomycetota bacterium]
MGFEEYNPVVMDHFLNPRNTGELRNPDASSFVENKACGDMVKLTMRVQDGVIAEARTQTFGCAAAIAAASALTELLIGRTPAQALELRDRDVIAKLGGLPEHKVKCSLVTQEAVKEALTAYAAKTG